MSEYILSRRSDGTFIHIFDLEKEEADPEDNRTTQPFKRKVDRLAVQPGFYMRVNKE